MIVDIVIAFRREAKADSVKENVLKLAIQTVARRVERSAVRLNLLAVSFLNHIGIPVALNTLAGFVLLTARARVCLLWDASPTDDHPFTFAGEANSA